MSCFQILIILTFHLSDSLLQNRTANLVFLQTEAQHIRYLLFRSVHKDILLYCATSLTSCQSLSDESINDESTVECGLTFRSAMLRASNVPLHRGRKNDFPGTDIGGCPRPHTAADSRGVSLDRPRHSTNRFDCWSVAVEDETKMQLSSMRHSNDILANPSCGGPTVAHIEHDHPCHREQILQRIFFRRALSAGDELDHRVDGIRDAIRQSDSSSAWFTR
jgi:hypothetical protein